MTRVAAVRHRVPAGVLVALALLVGAVGVLSYRYVVRDTGNVYRADGVMFRYPARWEERTSGTSKVKSPHAERWGTKVGISDYYDIVLVRAYPTDPASSPDTADDLDVIEPLITAEQEQALARAGGTLLSGPERVTVAGRPALRYGVAGTVDGIPVSSTAVIFFDGSTQYFINCQSAHEEAQITRGCDQILDTFELERLPRRKGVTRCGPGRCGVTVPCGDGSRRC